MLKVRKLAGHQSCEWSLAITIRLSRIVDMINSVNLKLNFFLSEIVAHKWKLPKEADTSNINYQAAHLRVFFFVI